MDRAPHHPSPHHSPLPSPPPPLPSCSYVLVDRVEDVTAPALLEADPAADRTVALFGFVRGTHLKPGMKARRDLLRAMRGKDRPSPMPPLLLPFAGAHPWLRRLWHGRNRRAA